MSLDISLFPNIDLFLYSLILFNGLIIAYIENVAYKAIKHWIKAGPSTSFEILPIISTTTYSKEPI